VRHYDKLVSSAGHFKIDSEEQIHIPVAETENSIAGLPISLRKDVEYIVSNLRIFPTYLGESLLKSSKIESRATNASQTISQAIVTSIFNSCFTSWDESLLLQFMENLCTLTCSHITVTQQEKMTISILNTYMHYTYSKSLVSNVMTDLILEIIQDLDLDLSNTNDKATEHQMNNIAVRLIHNITDRVDSLPYGLRYITKAISQLDGRHVETSVMQVVMENVFIRTLINPELYGITLIMGSRAKNNLLAIARCMTVIFSGIDDEPSIKKIRC